MKSLVYILAICFICFCSLCGYAQTWQWAKSSNGVRDEGFWDLNVTGNYIFGVSLTNGSSFSISGDSVINSATGGNSAICISKWDAAGSLIWLKSLQGFGASITLYPWAPKLTASTTNDVYFTSSFISDSLVSDTVALYNDTNSIEKYFICKLNANGITEWMNTHRTKNKLYTQGLDVKTNSQNEVIASMIYYPDTLYLSPDTFYNPSNGNDVVLIKYDSTGSIRWAASPRGNNNDLVLSLTVDNNDNIIGGGRTNSDSIWWDNYIYRTQVLTRTKNQILILKCNNAGQMQWVKSFGGSQNDFLTGIDVDGQGNIYAAGFFSSDSIVFDNTVIRKTNSGAMYFSIFIVKLDPSGRVLWSRSFGGSNQNYAEDIKVNPDGDFYVSGYFISDSVQFDQYTIYRTGSAGFYYVHMDSSGHCLSVKQLMGEDGIDRNVGRNGWGRTKSIAIDPNDRGTIYTAGILSGQYLDFDGTLLYNSNPLIMNTTDAFIAKLSGFPTGITENVNNVQELLIYPQPTSGKFQIKGLPLGKTNISIHNSLGRKILTKVIDTTAEQELDLSSYPSGVYLMQMEINGVQFQSKVMVSR